MEHLLKKINHNIAELTADIDEIENDFYNKTRPYKDQKYGKSDFQDKYGPKSYYFNMNIFEGKSRLFISSIKDDYGFRPQLQIDHNSTDIKLLRDDVLIDNLKTAGQYAIHCKVNNAGDLPVPIANIEFFIGPKFKPNDLHIAIDKHRVQLSKTITGINIFKVTATGKIKKGVLNINQTVIITSGGDNIQGLKKKIVKIFIEENGQKIATNNAVEGDLVILEYKLSKSEFNNLKPVGDQIINYIQPNNDLKDFELKVEDVFSITGRGIVVTGTVAQGMANVGDILDVYRGNQKILSLPVTGFEMFRRLVNQVSTGMQVGILLRGATKENLKKGDILSSRKNETIKIDKPNSLQDFEFLGSTTLSVPALNSAFVEFEFDPTNLDLKGKIIACRVYSLMPIDMPKNFDSFDPEYNRHVAVLHIK